MKPRMLETYGSPQRVSRTDLHEHAIDLATKMYSKTGRTAPLWLAASHIEGRGPGLDGYHMLVIETEWESPEEKYRATEFLRSFMNDKDLGVYAYAFICEAWVAAERKGDKYDEMRKLGLPVAPADRAAEDRDDILMIVSFERDGGSALTRFLTHDRGGPGKNFLGPRTEMDAVDPDSRMCLFPVKQAS